MALAEADLLEQEHEREVLAALMVAAGVPDLTLPPRPAWMALGACRDHPEVDFYDAPRRAARAKRICAGCPVREACLRWAMEQDEPDGVWGGLTPGERRALRPKRRPGRPRKHPRPEPVPVALVG